MRPYQAHNKKKRNKIKCNKNSPKKCTRECINKFSLLWQKKAVFTSLYCTIVVNNKT